MFGEFHFRILAITWFVWLADSCTDTPVWPQMSRKYKENSPTGEPFRRTQRRSCPFAFAKLKSVEVDSGKFIPCTYT